MMASERSGGRGELAFPSRGALRVAGLALLISGISAVRASAQGRAELQISARVVAVDTTPVAAARHLAAGEERWQPVRGSTVAEVRFEKMTDIASGDDPARSRRVVVSYMNN